MMIVHTCELQESESLDMHVDTVSDEVSLMPKDQRNWNMLWTDITTQSSDLTFYTCHMVGHIIRLGPLFLIW
jgi:hypothetical protein